MFRSIHSLARTLKTQRSQSRGPGPRRRSQLQLEALEDRALPSTFTVSTLADSGPGSLRQAVLDANTHAGADVIGLASGLTGTITLSSGQLSITDTLRIKGPGENQLTISGNQASRVFFIATPGVAVTLADLTVADGVAGSFGSYVLGGGLLNAGGNVTLNRVAFEGNVAGSASTPAGGGAVANVNLGAGSKLQIHESLFMDNHAAGTIADGGAISNLFGATLKVTNSSFGGNTADGIAIGIGGAVGSEGTTSIVTITTSEFISNQATALLGASDANPLQGEAVGGAIANTGGGQLALSRSYVLGNQALAGTGADGNSDQEGGRGGNALGGAVINSDASLSGALATTAFARITNSIFFNNVSVGGDGGSGGAGARGGLGGDGDGGAFYEDAYTRAVILGVEFDSNVAVGGRSGPSGTGGTGGLGGSSFGGAITVAGGRLNLSYSLLTQNQSLGGRGGDGGDGGPGGFAGSGALDAGNPAFAFEVASHLTVTQVLFTKNEAVGGAGGIGTDGHAGGIGGDARGGAMGATLPVPGTLRSTFVVTASDFTDNVAQGGVGGAGGIGAEGGDAGFASGGALSLFVTFSEPAARLTVTGGTFARNLAEGGAGGSGGLGGDGAAGGEARGGALALLNVTGTVSGALFAQNTAAGGLGGDGGDGGNGGDGGVAAGGAIRSRSSALTLTDVAAVRNQAQGGLGGAGGAGGNGGAGGSAVGGAVWSGITDQLPNAMLSIQGGQYARNDAIGGNGGLAGAGGTGGQGGDGLGGALYNSNSTSSDTGSAILQVVDALFVRNQALAGIGGLGDFFGDSGMGVGGAIYIEGGPASINNATTFLLNFADTSDNDVYGDYTTT